MLLRSLLTFVLANLLLVGLPGAPPAEAAIIYSDHFDGLLTDALNGKVPNFRNGYPTATWLAPDAGWKANGSRVSITVNPATAVLPFVPETGKIYELSASLNPTTSLGGDWIGIGFFNRSAGNDLDDTNVGYAWMLKRGDTGSPAFDIYTVPGPGVTGIASRGPLGGVTATPTELKIILDTQATDWKASFFVNGTLIAAANYTYTGSSPLPITHVGLTSLGRVNGTVDDFLLTIVPEPGSIALTFTACFAFIVARRRVGK
jgi:hypothetical protein